MIIVTVYMQVLTVCIYIEIWQLYFPFTLCPVYANSVLVKEVLKSVVSALTTTIEDNNISKY